MTGILYWVSLFHQIPPLGEENSPKGSRGPSHDLPDEGFSKPLFLQALEPFPFLRFSGLSFKVPFPFPLRPLFRRRSRGLLPAAPAHSQGRQTLLFLLFRPPRHSGILPHGLRL